MKIAIRSYWESVKILWKSGLLIFVPVFNMFLGVFALRANRTYPGLIGITANFFIFVVGVFVELIIIATIFKSRRAPLLNNSIWEVATRYFWRVVGIKLGSIFVLLVVISPLCFFLFLLLTAEINSIFSILLVFTVSVYVVFYFGTNFLGIRILIDHDKKIGESMWAGFQELNRNRSHYFGFISISFILFFLPSHIASILSLGQNSFSTFSTPLIPYERFYDNYLQIIRTVSDRSVFTILFVIFRYLLDPINVAGITLIYLNRPSSQSLIVNRQSEI